MATSSARRNAGTAPVHPGAAAATALLRAILHQSSVTSAADGWPWVMPDDRRNQLFDQLVPITRRNLRKAHQLREAQICVRLADLRFLAVTRVVSPVLHDINRSS